MENSNFYDGLKYREFKSLDFKRELMCEYVRYMLDKTNAMFKWTGLPDTIPARKLEEYLQTRGYVGIVNYDGSTGRKAGLYAVNGGLGGERDAYYEPTEFVFANPYLQVNASYQIYTREREIDECECVIIRNDSLRLGLMPMFTRYASLLTENAITLRISDINLRALLTMGAPDDKTKASAELYLTRLENGENAVIGETAFFDGVNYHDSTHPNNHMKDLIEYEQYLKASWFNEIGLDSNYNMKRERISESEVNQNSDALIPLMQDMLNNRKECAEDMSKFYDTEIGVELDSVWADVMQETTEETDEVSKRLESEYDTLTGGGKNEKTE